MNTNESPQLSRRTLAAGAAWAVPVVAAAAAAPHVNASGYISVTVSGACKSPGNSTVCGKSYLFATVVVTSHLPVSATVEFTDITATPDPGLENCSGSQQVPGYLIVGQPFTLAAGAQKTYTMQQCSTSSANIQNTTFHICWKWTATGNGNSGTDCLDVTVPSTPPDCSAALCP